MPLTPEEQRELDSLNTSAPKASGLTPAEQQELDSLNGGAKPAGSTDAQGPGAGLVNSRAWSPTSQKIMQEPRNNVSPQDAQQMGTAFLPGMANTASKAVGAGGSLLKRLGMAGLQGGTANVAMNNPSESAGDKLAQFLTGGATGVGLQGASEMVSAGANKAADFLMQKASGMKKITPGTGNSLVDQGVGGTRGMITGQVTSKLPGVEQEVQDAVNKIPGTLPTQDLADAISKKGTKFTLSTGETPANMASYTDKVRDASEGVAKIGGGAVAPADMLKLKRQGDWLGFTNAGNPATSLEAELGRTQADAARSVLSKSSEGAVPAALGKEQALILAKNALAKPPTLYKSPLSLSDLGLTAIGTALSGGPGAALGLATSKAINSPVVQSGAAHAAQRLVKPAADSVANNPDVLQTLLNGLFAKSAR